jgi:endo-1,4-beta-xylanase
MKRRSLLKSIAGGCALAMPWPVELARALASPEASGRLLKAAAKEKGKILGVFSGAHQLTTDEKAAQLISSEFEMLAIGNDLKMNRVHPEPDRYDFGPGDYDLAWSQKNGMLFRGHTLIWHNALPKWFDSYVNKSNAERVMTDHITTVVKHYAGKFYSWDVVNEPIHNDRPDQLRRKPWLDLIGPEYIDIAFRTAAAADPQAKLLINECYIEEDSPGYNQRRDAYLQLITRLKNSGVPIHGVGIQGHIKAGSPLSKAGMTSFLTALKDMNLEVLITELDVDDSGIPEPQVDEAVARTYQEFLEIVGPFAKVITFEALADVPQLPKRSDGNVPRPNLWDTDYRKKPAYDTTLKALSELRN